MTSFIACVVSRIVSVFTRYRQKRLEQQALRTIIARKNDHLRRDVALMEEGHSVDFAVVPRHQSFASDW